jgi:oxalate decarboxylase/phosphoglucose isomerase-like protein (cupin superfamily)
MFKLIHIRAPHRTSLQFHERKQESNYLLDGRAVLHYSEELVDGRRFGAGGYGADELARLVRNLRTASLAQGDAVHIPPGCLHRIEAVEGDVTFVETSTDHADDVYRLEDDANRSHGRIEQEHG